MNKISPETRAVIDAIDKVRWDWGNMREADAETVAITTLRAIVKELKHYGITEKNILRIANKLEQIK
jgi:hypothetical protein